MVLEIEDLSVSIRARAVSLPIVRGINFHVAKGEILGVVGESGCGKSVTNLAIMGLLPPGTIVQTQRFKLCGRDMATATARDWREMRGKQAAMIFQNPMSALNPSLSIGVQISEAIRRAEPHLGRTACAARAISLLDEVGIAAARSRLHSYAHELSGGMAQRVMIAMALASKPDLLIADEPTTGLDSIIQVQILELLLEIRQVHNTAMILVSHDIGVVRECADRVQVMYSGEVVETGPVAQVTTQPAHPYTHALMHSLPGSGSLAPKTRLHTIPGIVPPVGMQFDGCRFAPRCDRAQAFCHSHPASIRSQGETLVQCHF